MVGGGGLWYAMEPFLEPLTGVMQETLMFVGELCGRTGLEVNPDKVAIIVCTRNHKWSLKCLLKMRGQELVYQNNVTYLDIKDVTGAMKTAVTTALIALLKIQPLHITLMVEAAKAWSRVGYTNLRRYVEKSIAPLRIFIRG